MLHCLGRLFGVVRVGMYHCQPTKPKDMKTPQQNMVNKPSYNSERGQRLDYLQGPLEFLKIFWLLWDVEKKVS